MRALGVATATAISAILLSGALPPRFEIQVKAASTPVTWRGQIAPLFFAHCTTCHHAGGSGPFSLTTLADARRYMSVIELAVTTRFMPPWLPVPGHGDFADSRRLGDDQIALVQAWARAGMLEGDGPEPVAPVYSSDWQLGPPDLVLETETPVEVPATGTDVFTNVILPYTGKGTRWVRAMEIKPGSPRIVHHANVILDRTASLRRENPDAWRKGVPGMDINVDSGDSFDPDSHFLFWKPDSTALVEPKGMPWRLDEGNDLVLNLHLKPTGKAETTKVRIGLYFTPEPATKQPILVQLEHDGALDIPAGDKNFVIEDSLKLPVAAEVLGIYPHAHYLAKRMEAWATLPNGERRWLILIDDWDIDRQSVYRLAKPLPLAAGSVLHMRYVYDNSVGNVRNPHSPPVEVKAGNRSEDEMGHFWLQLLPIPTQGKTEAQARAAIYKAWMESVLRKSPRDSIALYNLASLDLAAGNAASAEELYRRALVQKPGDARTLTALGSAMEASGDWQGAQAQFRAARESDSGYADATFDLASLDLRHGELVEAEAMFRAFLTAHPDDAPAHAGLANTLLAAERGDEAEAEFRRAVAIDPKNFEALYGLGTVAAAKGDLAAAEARLTAALGVKADPDAERQLAIVYAGQDRLALAVEHLKAWQLLAPKDANPHRALSQVYRQMGQLADSLREQKAVLALAPASSGDWNDLGVIDALAGDKAAARKDFEEALKLDAGNQAAKSNLQKL
jgi:Flp pilus assembly protein TadD/mono/diheme cytochrome c family protein